MVLYRCFLLNLESVILFVALFGRQSGWAHLRYLGSWCNSALISTA